MIRIITAMACLAISSTLAADPSVEAKDGNILLHTDSGETKTLTTSGKDTAPVLSTDGNWIVFIRATAGKKIPTGSGEYDPQELWQIDAAGKEPVLLVKPRASNEMKEVISTFHNLQFSTDGRFVYFDTPAWTTSSAVHVVDTTNSKERFLVAGDGVKVIPRGEYQDCLLLGQHRYFLGGGSYDWLWLFRPDGTEIGPVGEDAKNFMETYCSDKTEKDE
ncbi:TolB family protein [Luteolibacter soli]|uniref:Translocation protein TolB n=1 Tax=Luteolibacter soli TaxID=3135280 RepID=A0ABU9AVJ6_9BACT